MSQTTPRLDGLGSSPSRNLPKPLFFFLVLGGGGGGGRTIFLGIFCYFSINHSLVCKLNKGLVSSSLGIQLRIWEVLLASVIVLLLKQPSFHLLLIVTFIQCLRHFVDLRFSVEKSAFPHFLVDSRKIELILTFLLEESHPLPLCICRKHVTQTCPYSFLFYLMDYANNLFHFFVKVMKFPLCITLY